MEEQKNINLEFYEPDEDAIPFVKVIIKGKGSRMIPVLMLMDSGSSLNMLVTEVRELIDPQNWLPEESTEMVSITNETLKTPCANFCFEMNGKKFQEKFCFMENFNVMEYKGVPLVGVLGIQFMQKHHLCIDYINRSVCTSDLFSGNTRDNNVEYYIPVEYGIKYYNAPTIEIKGKNRNIIMVVDTGTDSITISREVIEDNMLPFKLTGNNYSIDGPNGSVDAEECMLELNIPVHSENGICELKILETMMIIPNSINTIEEGECDDDGNPLSTIDGLLSSPFMAKQGWILDFAQKVIYKLK